MKPWLKSEIEWCALDKKPEGLEANQLVYQTRSLNKDFRRAEALTMADKSSIDLIQVAKVLLSRGHLENANIVLDQAVSEVIKESLDYWEIKFEQSRLFSYKGDWEKTKELTSEVISSCSTGITVMGAYQIRALAHTELGNFKQALSDVEKVISLGTLYPKAFSLFYAEVQKARLLFLDNNKSGSDQMRERLWGHVIPVQKNHKADLDLLLTLSRLELFSKTSGSLHEVYNLLRLQWTCAEIMGDDLYRSFSEAYGFILGLTKTLSDDAQKFERIRNLFTGSSTEATHLRNLAGQLNGSMPKEKWEPVRLVYISSKQTLIDLMTLEGKKVSQKHHQLFEIIKGNDLLSMEEVFSKVSGLSYKSSVHRNYISNVIYQINRSFPSALKIVNGKVIADRCVVLSL